LAIGTVVLAGRAVCRRRGCHYLSAAAARSGRAAAGLAVAGRLGEDVALLESDRWCAFYINLARRPDRRERLLGLLGASSPELLGRLERVDAVDGRSIKLDEEAVGHIIDDHALERAEHAQRRGAYTIVHNGPNLLHFDNHLTVGGIACAMSHRLALEAVASHPTADWGLILEDDITAAVPCFDQAMAQLLRGLPSDWDAVFLGYHDCNGAPHPSALEPCDSANEGEAAVAEVPAVRRMTEPLFGLFAWVVRKEAAQELLENAFPIGGQVDHALSSWLVCERGRCYAVEPGGMLFFSPKSEVGEDSDVQTMATVDAMLERYESWEGYYNHVWGIDNLVEDYVASAFGYDEEEEGEEGPGCLRTFAPMDLALPPCEVPTPECMPTDFPDNF